jgi:hypothetical protein
MRTVTTGLTAGLLATAVLTGQPPVGQPAPVAADTSTIRVRSLPFALTAAIAQDPTTVGMADSYLYSLSDADVNTSLDALQAMGVNDIRIGVPWLYIQPTSSKSYDWAKLDYIVDAASQRGMNILAVINGTPSWAGSPIISGQPNLAAFSTFATAVATRYEGKIYDYEIWNEPNGATGMSPVSAAAYTKLLKAGYTAIKSVDAGITVIGGVLGAVATVAGLTVNPVTFVQQMYADGAQGYFDALSFHPYNYTLPFSLGGNVSGSPLQQVEAIRSLMDANGDSAMKIWISEYGLPTNVVSQDQQATYITDFVSAWQSFVGAGPIFIYTTRDSDTGNWNSEDNYGIFQTNWTPKKAVAALTAIIKALDDGTFVPTTVDPNTYKGPPLYTSALILTTQFVSLAAILPSIAAQIVTSFFAASGNTAQQLVANVGHAGYQFGQAIKPLVPEPIFDGIAALTHGAGQLGVQVQKALHEVAIQAFAASNDVVNRATGLGIQATAHVLAGIVQVVTALEGGGAKSSAAAVNATPASATAITVPAITAPATGAAVHSAAAESSTPEPADSATSPATTAKSHARPTALASGARHSKDRVVKSGARAAATTNATGSTAGQDRGDGGGGGHRADRHPGANAS